MHKILRISKFQFTYWVFLCEKKILKFDKFINVINKSN